MDRFQVVELTEQFNHAGTKATADISLVADNLGFQRIDVKMDTVEDSILGKVRRQMGYYRDWKEAGKVVKENSILLLQHPFHHRQLTREKTLKKIKEKKHVKIISVIHDVEELRAFRYNDYYEDEFRTMLDLADCIIVHNDIMKDWFISRGVSEERLITLDVFDYIQNDSEEKEVKFEKSITIAGNLDTTKCGYIGQLGELSDVTIHLYGPNFDEKLRGADNITYHGSFPVDEIPSKLDKGFGLVWDGDSILGCKGQSGQYLRYNNPHKLSLYLSSGLPVVIWREAAEAKFVENNGVGLLVDSLEDLGRIFEKIDDKSWSKLVDNASQISQKLRNGHFAQTALSKAVDLLNDA